MPNNRIYSEVDGLVANGVAVGGVTAITTEQGYVDNIDSENDGTDGPSDVDQAGQQVAGSVETTDVLQGIPLLLSTPTTAVFFGKESGAATWGKTTLANPVFHALRFAAQRGQYASIGVDFQCRFAAAADTFDDVEVFLRAQTVPTLTHPGRLWRPGSATHGSDPGLTAVHVQGITFTLAGRLLVDFDGDDLGTTVVDVAGYGAGAVELTIRDLAQQTGPPTHEIATALMNNGVQDLVIGLKGVGDTADKTLTLRNCTFNQSRKSTGRDFTGRTISGRLQWRDPTGAPPVIRTIDDATAADRLIDFA